MNNDHGAPHALEHLVFFGSQRHPFKGFLDDFAVQRLCSEINAHTDSDRTCYQFWGCCSPCHGLEEVAVMLLEHLLHPLIPYEAFRTEIYDAESRTGVMYFEIAGRDDDIAMNVELEAKRLLYTERGSHNSVAAGLPQEIGSLCVSDIRAYHKRFYHPSNMTLVIQGDIDLTFLLHALDKLLQDSSITVHLS